MSTLGPKLNSNLNSNLFKISSLEKRSAFMLSLIFGVRMLGLFMILPVFSLYIGSFQQATPFLMGVALGIYGFSSGVCQIFFGILSDILGRKSTITLALVIFALGSLVAAKAHTIDALILGRLLQGAGASGSAILALLADLTRPESRSKAMAIIGMMIGISFVAAMILGPWINHFSGLSGIFYLTAILAILGMLILWFLVPNPEQSVFHEDQQFRFSAFKQAISNLNLWRLNLGVLLLHAILVGVFVALPWVFKVQSKMTQTHQEFLYLITLVLSFVSVVPFIIVSEKKGMIKEFSLAAIGLLVFAIFIFMLGASHMWLMSIGLWIFFTGFIFLEATLPSWLSKVCPLKARGTSFGVYSSCQFFGAFLGGSLSGFFLGNGAIGSLEASQKVFIFVMVLALFWLIIKVNIKRPPYRVTRMLSIPFVTQENSDEVLSSLRLISGVVDVQLGVPEKTAYLRVEKIEENVFNQSSEEALKQWQKGH